LGLTPTDQIWIQTPGRVNPQLIKQLLGARVVIADLTGSNPNVFYELGIVHSFARPVIALADSAKSLPFDAHDERVIELGEHQESLSVTQAEEGKSALRRALKVVLSPQYIPASPVAEVAARRSLDQLAPDDPIAAELTAIREAVQAIKDEAFIVRRSDSGSWTTTQRQIAEKEFTKAMRGYAMHEVDTFLDILTETVGAKDNEIAELHAKLAQLQPRRPRTR
jgi:DivIVA domain-containing protein